MQNGDRVQFVSCPALPAVTDSATFYYLQDSDKLYLGSQLIANNVKDVQNSETPGKLRIIQFDGSTREIDIPGNAFGIDCYKGKLPLDFTSPGGVIDEWKIYGNSSRPAEVLETQSTLPISIDTYGGNAVDWEIYGNNNPVVENKTGDLPIEVSATAGNAVDWVIYGNDNNGTENFVDISTSTLVQVNAQGVLRYGVIVSDIPAGEWTISINTPVRYPYYLVKRVGSVYTNIGNSSGIFVPQTITLDEQCDLIIRTASLSETTWETYLGVNPVNMMVTKGSTAPDHYIPYQKGVGERTENLCPMIFSHTGIIDDKGQIDTLDTRLWSVMIPVESNADYVISITGTASNGAQLVFNRVVNYDVNKNFINRTTVVPLDNRKTITTESNVAYIVLDIRTRSNDVNIQSEDVNTISVTKGSTAPDHYIPYGYQIPLTDSQAGQTDKNYNIYIGDSPLTEGETVSKSLAGVDIELFNGNNIIDTSLYNKPNTSITYNSSVLGVGENTEIAGELPIDFRSNGDDLLGYKIYGTANGAGVQTENLFDKGSAVDGYWLQASNGATVAISGYCVSDYIPIVAGETYFSYHTGRTFCWYDQTKTFIETSPTGTSATAPQTASFLRVNLLIANKSIAVLTNFSTAPDHYIPFGYKLPLTVESGEQSTDIPIYIGDAKLGEDEYVDYGEQKIYRRNIEDYLEPIDPPLPLPAIETFKGENTLDSTETLGETMITQGYRIPLQIKQGTTTKTADFYIGSSPLTEGQSISKTSTGTEIALYQGNNIISTTLGNKPEMKIDYLSTVVGVGERTENLFDVSKVTENTSGGHTFIKVEDSKIYVNLTAAVAVPDGSRHTLRDLVGELKLNTAYTLLLSTTGTANYIFLSGTDANFTWGSTVSKTFTTQTALDGALNAVVYYYASGQNSSAVISDFMLVEGSTPPSTYVPYGYQIPIDIIQGDEVVDHKDIYIGTQPLIEGDYINQTGVYRRLQQFVDYIDSTALPDFDFIPITEQLIAENGENTITTSLVNNTTIDVELHPTTHASWICDKLEELQRRIDNVDSTLGAPERRNYLVTWCSETRLTHTGTSSAPLTTEFTNSSESAESVSVLTISGTSYATGEFMQTIDLLAMVTNYAHYYAGSSNYTVARPGDYVVIIYNTVCSEIAANQSILLQIVQNDNVVITQALTDEYVGCVPFKILNLDVSRTVTQVRLVVQSADAWTALNCQIDIAIVNASMVYQDSAALIDTNPRLSSMSLYDTVISANQQLQASLIDLTNRVEALEHGTGSTYNETQTDTVTDSVEEVTQ